MTTERVNTVQVFTAKASSPIAQSAELVGHRMKGPPPPRLYKCQGTNLMLQTQCKLSPGCSDRLFFLSACPLVSLLHLISFLHSDTLHACVTCAKTKYSIWHQCQASRKQLFTSCDTTQLSEGKLTERLVPDRVKQHWLDAGLQYRQCHAEVIGTVAHVDCLDPVLPVDVPVWVQEGASNAAL